MLQRQLAGKLLTLLFAVANTVTTVDTFNDNLVIESRTSILILSLFKDFKIEFNAVFLTPFNEFTLEIHFFISHLVDVNHLSQDAMLHEVHACIIASVEINSTDKRLESISSHVAVVRRTAPVTKYQFADTQLIG